jgi:hypothetical protein
LCGEYVLKTLKYFSTLFVLAWRWLPAGGSGILHAVPWTRDGKVAPSRSASPRRSPAVLRRCWLRITSSLKKEMFCSVSTTPLPYRVLNAQAQLAKAQSDLAKANNEANRRRHLSQNYISAEDLDTANINVKAMQASVNVAEATLKQAQWQLTQTVITAPVDGWVTNLSPAWGTTPPPASPFCPGRQPLLLRVGYFEETKLRHIREGLQRLRFTAARKRYRVTSPALVAPFTIKALKQIPAWCRTSSRTSLGASGPARSGSRGV